MLGTDTNKQSLKLRSNRDLVFKLGARDCNFRGTKPRIKNFNRPFPNFLALSYFTLFHFI